jgi:SAM-dependent methyltransferase
VSSPIANPNRSRFQEFLVGLHQSWAHGSRTQKLATLIGSNIAKLYPETGRTIQALDVGCGDMTIAESIQATHPHIHWTCTDIHQLPTHLTEAAKWKKYRRFDGSTLPFADRTFDLVLFSDVLHHCLPKAPALLREAGRVGRHVMVKDHFEHGWLSRSVLRLLDFAGNFGYGIPIPDRYFTKQTFATTAAQAGLESLQMNNHIILYPSCLSLVFPPHLQFLALLEPTKP